MRSQDTTKEIRFRSLARAGSLGVRHCPVSPVLVLLGSSHLSGWGTRMPDTGKRLQDRLITVSLESFYYLLDICQIMSDYIPDTWRIKR